MIKNVRFVVQQNQPKLPFQYKMKTKHQMQENDFFDVVGPITPSSVDRFCYFVTLIDDFSSHACVTFMRHKNQALQKFQECLAENVTPHILRFDNGTEYTKKSFKQFRSNNKIKRDYTVPENPEQNGVAERYKRTVVETARSILRESKLPKSREL